MYSQPLEGNSRSLTLVFISLLLKNHVTHKVFSVYCFSVVLLTLLPLLYIFGVDLTKAPVSSLKYSSAWPTLPPGTSDDGSVIKSSCFSCRGPKWQLTNICNCNSRGANVFFWLRKKLHTYNAL